MLYRSFVVSGSAAAALAVATSLAVCPVSAVAAEAESVTLESLSFLAGCWMADLGGGDHLRETFTSPNAGVILGNSQLVMGGETQFFEFTRILDVEGRLEYDAHQDGTSSRAYTLGAAGPASVTFLNPTDSYPKTVTYEWLPEGMLQATITGVSDADSPGTQRFKMRAVRCGDAKHRGALANR
ncbi:MAG: DUF6265 family protein [Pseudomonadota bacterium]